MITGAIQGILTPERIAMAKAIAPDGPAAFRISNCDQCFDHSPDNISKATSAGKPNNLIAETRQIVFLGPKAMCRQNQPKSKQGYRCCSCA